MREPRLERTQAPRSKREVRGWACSGRSRPAPMLGCLSLQIFDSGTRRLME
jgi:hypothetical protein